MVRFDRHHRPRYDDESKTDGQTTGTVNHVLATILLTNVEFQYVCAGIIIVCTEKIDGTTVLSESHKYGTKYRPTQPNIIMV